MPACKPQKSHWTSDHRVPKSLHLIDLRKDGSCEALRQWKIARPPLFFPTTKWRKKSLNSVTVLLSQWKLGWCSIRLCFLDVVPYKEDTTPSLFRTRFVRCYACISIKLWRSTCKPLQVLHTRPGSTTGGRETKGRCDTRENIEGAWTGGRQDRGECTTEGRKSKGRCDNLSQRQLGAPTPGTYPI